MGSGIDIVERRKPSGTLKSRLSSASTGRVVRLSTHAPEIYLDVEQNDVALNDDSIFQLQWAGKCKALDIMLKCISSTPAH